MIPRNKPNAQIKPTKRLETRALFAELAERTSLPVDTIRLVFDTFTNIVLESMLDDTKVIVRHFGAFYAKVIKQGSAIRFRPAQELKAKVQEGTRRAPMEKLGVELNNEAVLLAKVTGKCPACKSDLASKDPPRCPNCGTEPFEATRKS